MDYSLDNIRNSELKPDDLFEFECDGCGNCCRKRSTPIAITGADLFIIAQKQGMTPQEVAEKYTEMEIGKNSRMPVLYLQERLDGSCKFLRTGRCTIQEYKPAICALFPLGRYYDPKDEQIHYIPTMEGSCSSAPGKKGQTVQDWVDSFHLAETDDMFKAWSKLICGLAVIMMNVSKESVKGAILQWLMTVLYFGYDTSKPFVPQVEAHIALIKDAGKEVLNQNFEF